MSGYFKKALPAIVALSFLSFMLLFIPFRNCFQFDGDEGINLMKASMVAKGYSLYNQIWSDQPPLLTYILVGTFKLFGPEVNVARVLILFLSTVLLLACYMTLRMIWGDLHALAGTLLIVILPAYMRLSVSVMVGLPSITFAMLSLLAVVLWHQQRKPLWLIMSSLALSISVLIKLFTGYLIPIIVVGLLADEFIRRKGRLRLRDIVWPACLWTAIFAVMTTGAVLIWIGAGHLDQLVQSHLRGKMVFDNVMYTINSHLNGSKTLLLLSLLGVGFSVRSKRWLSLYLIAWAGAAYLLLLLHSPVWYHHQLLITVPAAMLGGIAFVEGGLLFLRALQSRKLFSLNTLIAAITLVSFASVLFTQIMDERHFRPSPRFGANLKETSLQVTRVFAEMYLEAHKYAPYTQWMLTDLPMLPFRLGMKVPPNLVVFSNKRFMTDLIADRELQKTIDEFRPEQVLMCKPVPGIDAHLGERYQLVFACGIVKLYIRDDIYLQHEASH